MHLLETLIGSGYIKSIAYCSSVDLLIQPSRNRRTEEREKYSWIDINGGAIKNPGSKFCLAEVL